MAQLLTRLLASALGVAAVPGAAAEIPATPEDGGPRLREVTGAPHVLNLRERPDGRTRIIFVRNGLPIGADTSEADAYGEFRDTKENDLHLIRVGDEGYEIPDAVPLGG
jgi:hypothetical protein